MSTTKITEIKGTITLADGTTSEFRIGTDAGWAQWGADRARLGITGEDVETMARALAEDGRLVSDSDEDEDDPATRLEYLRGELRAGRLSYGELAELADLAPHIDPDDVELLEAAGVPEHGPEREAQRQAWNVAHHEPTD